MLWALSASIQAQDTMLRFLEKTPDPIFEFVSHESFVKMADEVQGTWSGSGVGKIELVNRFDEKSVADTIATDYASLSLSNTLQVQMMALPVSDADTVVCVVSTYAAPEKESVVRFYDLDWNRLNTADYLSIPHFQELCARPDTMSVEQYERLLTYLDPQMIYAQILPQQRCLVFKLATPLLNQDETMQVNAILLHRKVKWMGNSFK